MSNTENNNRIAKNTLLLYFRMLLTMAVSLYTSRIVLNTLGIEDFGIYNVVGGFITMFGFLNNAMATATQRFFSFELGRKDFKRLSQFFSMSVNIHFVIALVLLLLAETFGLWFINTQLKIPSERMLTANWVYQFSILTFLVGVISVPYNAVIIAHERMKVFARISLIEVLLNLSIVFMLKYFGYDKLRLYAILIFGVSLIIRTIYGIYCYWNFKESKYHFFWDKSLFKTMINFASWNLWGSAAVVLYSQGVNILLNVFFGPIINAAYGIASRLQAALNSFVISFQTAMNPQIIKSYAIHDLTYMHQLVNKGAKYSFFLLFTLSLPILIETEFILKLWLKIIPEYSVVFTRLIIINILISNLSGSLGVAAQATGNIKLYQGIVGGLLLLILPFSYLFFHYKFPPTITFYIAIIFSIISLFVRLIIVKTLIKINIREYFLQVIWKSIFVGSIAIIVPCLIYLKYESSMIRLSLIAISSFVCNIVSIYFIGLDNSEKNYIYNFLRKEK